MLSSLARTIQILDTVARAEKHGFCGELERLFLWGEGFRVGDGELDILELSAELRDNVLSFLPGIGKVVAQGAIAHFLTGTREIDSQDHVRLFQVNQTSTFRGYTLYREGSSKDLRMSEISSQMRLRIQTDISEGDFEGFLDDLKIYNNCPMDLTPALEQLAPDIQYQ